MSQRFMNDKFDLLQNSRPQLVLQRLLAMDGKRTDRSVLTLRARQDPETPRRQRKAMHGKGVRAPKDLLLQNPLVLG